MFAVLLPPLYTELVDAETKGATMHDLTNLLAQMNAMMNDVHGQSPFDRFRGATWHPPVDIYETEKCITIVAELPGVEKQDIDVDVVEGVLRISGVKHRTAPEDTNHVYQLEVPYGPFARFVRLPCAVNVERIEAEYRDGYLTVCVPRGTRNG